MGSAGLFNGRYVTSLHDTGEFLTLGTKLLAALTRVARGEVSRQVLNFKETETTAGRAGERRLQR